MSDLSSTENRAAEIRRRFGLSSLHLFTSDIPKLEWRVFASRLEPTGIEASCESGGGRTIAEALDTLEARLLAGPINKPHIPILDPPLSASYAVIKVRHTKRKPFQIDEGQ